MASMLNLFWSSFAFLIFATCYTYVEVHGELNLDKSNLYSLFKSDFSKTNITLNDVKEMLYKKCINVSGVEEGKKAFNEIESGFALLNECLNNILNYTIMQQEIDEAKPRGELDIVFNKYCNKRANALECFENFNTNLLPCLDEEEQGSKNVLQRIVRSLLNFVCYKDGDQIALFIAEKGPECFETQMYNIQLCMNNTFSTFSKTSERGEKNFQFLPKFVVGEAQCDDLKNIETCIVHNLERCSEITPANLVESMFKFIRNETLCRNFQQVSENGATIIQFKTFMYILLFVLLFLNTHTRKHFN